MTGARLLAAFGTAGGRPPATLESLRVGADGRARAIVGAAWPHGSPQDEAGLYEELLDDGALDALRGLAERPGLRLAAGEHGPIRPGSGRSSLVVAGADDEPPIEVAWGAFAQLPAAVGEAEAQLRAVLARVREHPVMALRLGVEPAGDGAPGGRATIALTLANRGRRPLAHALLQDGAELPRVAAIAAGGRDGPLPLSTYHAATPVVLVDPPPPTQLDPGAAVRVRATVAGDALAGAGATLVAFARGTVQVTVDGAPLGLDAFLIATR